MKTLAFISSKGGVGKSALATNLAVAAGQVGIRTILFDLDNQESATVWGDRRSSEELHIEFLTERRLAEALQAAKTQGFGLAVLDTPPAAGTQAYAAAQAADLILVPCRASLVDLDAIKRTALLVKSTGTQAFVVFNAAPVGATTLLKDASAIVQEAGLEPCPIIVRERSAFRAAWPFGKAVMEVEPNGKAATEVAALTKWVLAYFGGLNKVKGDCVQG